MNVKLSSPYNVETGELPQGSPIPGMGIEDFGRLAAQICIFVPHRPVEGVDASVSQAAGLWGQWGLSYGPIEDQFGGEIAATRGGMVKAFLGICQKTDARCDELGRPRLKYLVMIDNDEKIDPIMPLQLAFWDLPVVSGVVCSPSEHGQIKACFTVKDAQGKPRFPTYMYTRTIPARGLKEVYSVGAGLICIRRDVLEAVVAAGEIPFYIPDEMRRECWDTGTMRWGEDISFCRQLDALGIKKYVDFSVRAPHMKSVPIVWPEWYIDAQGHRKRAIDPDLDPRDWTVDERDYAHEF